LSVVIQNEAMRALAIHPWRTRSVTPSWVAITDRERPDLALYGPKGLVIPHIGPKNQWGSPVYRRLRVACLSTCRWRLRAQTSVLYVRMPIASRAKAWWC